MNGNINDVPKHHYHLHIFVLIDSMTLTVPIHHFTHESLVAEGKVSSITIAQSKVANLDEGTSSKKIAQQKRLVCSKEIDIAYPIVFEAQNSVFSCFFRLHIVSIRIAVLSSYLHFAPLLQGHLVRF